MAIRIIAPIVDVIIDPSQLSSEDMFKKLNSQLPTYPPTIPRRIFMSVPPEFDFMIFPASQPATAPINTDTKIPIFPFWLKLCCEQYTKNKTK